MSLNELNAKKCFQLLIEHNKFFNTFLVYMDENNTKDIPVIEFLTISQDYVSKIRDRFDKNDLDRLITFLNIKVLEKNKFIICSKNNNHQYFNFAKHIEETLRHISEDYSLKINLKTEGVFKDHKESLKRKISEFNEYNILSENERLMYKKDLINVFQNIRHNFREHMESIENRSQTLSNTIQKNSTSKKDTIKELIVFNEQYIEPFLYFIKDNENDKNSFSEIIKDISRKIYSIDEHLAFEINNFTINFSKYKDKLSIIISKINEYKRQNEEEIKLFNAIEKGFNEILELVKERNDGRKINYQLITSDFHKKFDFLNKILSNDNNLIKIESYNNISKNIINLEKDLQVEYRVDEAVNEIEIKRIDNFNYEQYNNYVNDDNQQLIYSIIHQNFDNLSQIDSLEVFNKIHQLLKEEFKEKYEIYFSIFATSYLLTQTDNIFYGYDKFHKIEIKDEFTTIIYKYLPLYAYEFDKE